MQSEILRERFFTAAISGQRNDARRLIHAAIDDQVTPEALLTDLVWPTVQQVQELFRADQLSLLAHNYATRLLRSVADQIQPQLTLSNESSRRTLVISGAEQSEELAAQIVADLLEARGLEVFYAGGGISNDEIVNQIGEMKISVLVVFGAVASTVPQTRLLIDRLHDIGVCPDLQIVVGGGVFNRADGLAEEIGSDVWANDPAQIVEAICQQPAQRMSPSQRTVGRRRRGGKNAA